MGKTLFEKIWESHIVVEKQNEPALVYIDRHLVHEVTSPQAFDGLRMNDRKVRRPDLTIATMDHNVPTSDRSLPILDQTSAVQIKTLENNCKDFGIKLFDINSPNLTATTLTTILSMFSVAADLNSTCEIERSR